VKNFILEELAPQEMPLGCKFEVTKKMKSFYDAINIEIVPVEMLENILWNKELF